MRVPEGTMFAGLFGELTVHPWRNSPTVDSDAYSLFYSRSVAMGWIRPHAGGNDVFWGMNDAGQNDGSTAGGGLPYSVWFQVSLGQPLSDSVRLLPLHPFLCCVNSVVARLGTLQLDSLQVLLPIQSIGRQGDSGFYGHAVGDSVSSAGWFSDPNPASRTRVQVVLDGGQSNTIQLVASDLFQTLQSIKQTVFLCDGLLVADSLKIPNPDYIDGLWIGPTNHPITLEGTLVEWSLDVLGWLAAFLAQLSSGLAVSTPLLMSVRRID